MPRDDSHRAGDQAQLWTSRAATCLGPGRGLCNDKPRPFRFLNLWTLQEDFLSVIKESWECPCEGSSMRVLCIKLKRLRGHIQQCNNEVFGDIFRSVKQREEEVRLAEARMENDGLDEACSDLHLVQARLRRVLRMEERLLK